MTFGKVDNRIEHSEIQQEKRLRVMQLANPAAGTRDGGTPELTENLVQPQPQNGWGRICAHNPWVSSAIVLAIIVGVEALLFGASVKKTGFYLDDWLMLKQLALGPQSYADMIFKYLTTDPRVIIRPIEAVHFGTVFFFSGTDPVGWRLSNMAMEVLSAFLVYLILARLSVSRLMGFFAALFFVTYPVHDSTHYWAVCSCVSLSLTLYLASLWTTLKAAAASSVKVRNVWLVSAYLFFALSIYGYEPFLPLCALNAAAYVLATRGLKPFAPAVARFIVHGIPYALIIGSLLVYQRTIVPMILKAALHKIHFDPGLIASTIAEGFRIISPLAMVPFISQHSSAFAQSADFNGGAIVRLSVLAALVALGAAVTYDVKQLSRKTAFVLMTVGLLTIAASYSIFGLNPEYTPTLITLVNRINTGAAFGLSIFVAGLLALFLAGANAEQSRSMEFTKVSIVTLLSVGLVSLFTMTNWNLGKPWEISWSVQERTFDAFRARRDEFENAKSIVLMNCPRYVDATPVFDGPWDFEQQLHIALGRTDVTGGVVSERLIVGPESVQDVTMNFACAEYPFKGLVLVTPGLTTVAPVATPNAFVGVVEREGRQFGLGADTIERWRSQVKNGVRRKKNGVLAPLSAEGAADPAGVR